jgi:hypothetical protein
MSFDPKAHDKRAIRWTAISITLALAAAAVGCEGRMPSQAESCGIVRPALGLALDAPQDWIAHDLSGDVVLEMYPASAAATSTAGAETTSPIAPRATPIIHVIVVDREGISLADWADRAVAEMKETTSNLQVVSRNPAKLADGHEALILELRNPLGVRPLSQRMLLALTGTRAYAVIATAPEGDVNAAPAFDKCFSTFVVW